MNCDQAFDSLTSPGATDNRLLTEHLAVCPRCRDMAEVLSPALELLAPAVHEDAGPETFASVVSQPKRSSDRDWVETAPWKLNVQSARRVRRDGLKIIMAVTMVAALTVAFAQFGTGESRSEFSAQVAAAECVRDFTEEVSADAAVAACVSCHMGLDETRIAKPPQTKAAAMILQCVDCHLDGAGAQENVLANSADLACLFGTAGG